jgi:hypothetical protein
MSTINAKVPYVQGLWKITYSKPAAPYSTPSSTDIRKPLERLGAVSGIIQRKDKLHTTSTTNVSRTTLRTRIHIRNPDVVDLPSPEFWSRHLQTVKLSESANLEGTVTELATVTLVTGSLDRDRVDEKSCALYPPPLPVRDAKLTCSCYVLDLLLCAPKEISSKNGDLILNLHTEAGDSEIRLENRQKLLLEIETLPFKKYLHHTR